MSDFQWRSESDEPAPTALSHVGDSLTAEEALKRVRKGEYLEYTGTFQNAKQLLSAMTRRLPKPAPSNSAKEAFRAERRARHLEHHTLAHLVVGLDREYALLLHKPPDVSLICRQVWGNTDALKTVVPLKTLLGMQGAAEWRRKGMAVPGLEGTLTPHYGVYVPTRTEYVELIRTLPEVEGKTVFELGAGTGILSFILLQRGAARVTATDIDPRAVTCAKENARRLSLADTFMALERSGYPEGKADLIVCNPPWLPEPAKNRIDRAVYDENHAFLLEFLNGLRAHVMPNGKGVLILSNLAVLLGLRPERWLTDAFASASLRVESTAETTPTHGKAKDGGDPLHAARSKEVTTRYILTAG
jgi:methylase of polypeptide subunit release factors